MQILINIPYDVYYACMTSGYCRYAGAFSKEMAYSVRNGVVLPENHGRLIDANILEECKEMVDTIMGECKYAVRMEEIRNIPTIIEADTEGE